MTTNEQWPDRKTIQTAINLESQNKDAPKLSNRQRRVYNLLCTGKHSVADISIRLGYGDPRSYIRCIRDAGIVVHDEWEEGDGTRWKR